MKRTTDDDSRIEQAKRTMLRTWLMWGLVPLAVSALLMSAVSTVWASPISADEHTIERGFQAVLAICAGLFLAGFWLDGKWTHSERLATRIWLAAGGEEFVPTRSQLAAQAEIAFKTIATSTTALTVIGGAIAVAAVISAWAGLGMGQCAQLVLLGLCYQLFVLSRHPYYNEVLTAAARGELVVPEDAHHHNRK